MTNSPTSRGRRVRFAPWGFHARLGKKSEDLLTQMRPLKLNAQDAYDEKNFTPSVAEVKDCDEALDPEIFVLDNLALSNVRAILEKEQRNAQPRKTSKYDYRIFDARLRR